MLYYKRGRRNKHTVQQIILSTIAEVGYLALTEVVPEAMRQFGSALGLKRKTDPRYDVPRGIRRLVGAGLLIKKKRGKRVMLELTNKGKAMLSKLKYNKLEIKKPKHWDKKWRIVIYDIKESRKRMRGELKDALRNIGFVLVQKSVWAYPYPCEDLLTMLKADFEVGAEVLYLVVDRMENDGWARKHFKLQ